MNIFEIVGNSIKFIQIFQDSKLVHPLFSCNKVSNHTFKVFYVFET
jgi:hypothetical protein